MSSGSEEKRMQLLGELARELRQFTGLGASFFRAAAARIGITVTDMQVIDVLHLTGPSTAGQLADLIGLTTGAITGMLNRLEEAGLVSPERDPNDGRRVIVRLERGQDAMHKIGPIFVHCVLASFETDDDSATIVGVTLPAHEPSLLQAVEHPRDRPGGKSDEIGELTSS